MSIHKSLETTRNNLHKETLNYAALGMKISPSLSATYFVIRPPLSSGFILLCSLKITVFPFYFLPGLFLPSLSGMPHCHLGLKSVLILFHRLLQLETPTSQGAHNWQVPQAMRQT